MLFLVILTKSSTVALFFLATSFFFSFNAINALSASAAIFSSSIFLVASCVYSFSKLITALRLFANLSKSSVFTFERFSKATLNPFNLFVVSSTPFVADVKISVILLANPCKLFDSAIIFFF